MREGVPVRAIVQTDTRDAIRRAHSATHILHHALQKTLGGHAQQQGSKVDSDWFRFDFSNQESLMKISSLRSSRSRMHRSRRPRPFDGVFCPWPKPEKKGP